MLYSDSNTLFCNLLLDLNFNILFKNFTNELVYSTALKWSWYWYYINLLKMSWIISPNELADFTWNNKCKIRIICSFESLVKIH